MFLNYIKNKKARYKKEKEDFLTFTEVDYIEEKDERLKKLKSFINSFKGGACETLNGNYIKFIKFYETYNDKNQFDEELAETMQMLNNKNHISKIVKPAELFYFIHKCCIKDSWKSALIPPSYLRNINKDNRKLIEEALK